MRIAKVGVICEIKNGYAFKSTDYVDAGYRVIRITNVQKGHVVDYDPKFSSPAISNKIENFQIKLGDILISLTGNVGRVGKIPPSLLPAVLNQRVGLIRPKSELVNGDYLFQYLNSDSFEKEAIKNSNGVAQLNLSSKWIESHEIPLPPLDDQIRIAHLLGKVEGLIAQRKQHLQQLDDLLKSVFLDMFGDPVRNEKGWEKKTAIDYADCIVPGRDKPKSFSGGIPWVTTSDLQHLGYTEKSRHDIGLSEDEIKEVRARVVPKSSVLLTCVGDLGVVSICTTDMVVNQQLHAFQVSKIMSEEFFMYSLSFQKKYMYQNASKTTVPYMNKSICNRVPMYCPPKELQLKFAEITKRVYRIKTRYQQSLSDLQALYGTLSQQAFKGELDLSRIPLGIRPEKENTVVVEPEQDRIGENLVIQLPDFDGMFEDLENAEGRAALIVQWLNAYYPQLGNRPFSVMDFMAAAESRLAALYPDNEFQLGVKDYECIKDWVFEALAAGRLTQQQNATGTDREEKYLIEIKR